MFFKSTKEEKPSPYKPTTSSVSRITKSGTQMDRDFKSQSDGKMQPQKLNNGTQPTQTTGGSVKCNTSLPTSGTNSPNMTPVVKKDGLDSTSQPKGVVTPKTSSPVISSPVLTPKTSSLQNTPTGTTVTKTSTPTVTNGTVKTTSTVNANNMTPIVVGTQQQGVVRNNSVNGGSPQVQAPIVKSGSQIQVKPTTPPPLVKTTSVVQPTPVVQTSGGSGQTIQQTLQKNGSILGNSSPKTPVSGGTQSSQEKSMPTPVYTTQQTVVTKPLATNTSTGSQIPIQKPITTPVQQTPTIPRTGSVSKTSDVKQDKTIQPSSKANLKLSQVAGCAWHCMMIGCDNLFVLYPLDSTAKMIHLDVKNIRFQVLPMSEDDDHEDNTLLADIQPTGYHGTTSGIAFKFAPNDSYTHIWYHFQIVSGDTLLADNQNVLIGTQRKIRVEIEKLEKKIAQLHLKQSDSGAMGMEKTLSGQIAKLDTKRKAYQEYMDKYDKK